MGLAGLLLSSLVIFVGAAAPACGDDEPPGDKICDLTTDEPGQPCEYEGQKCTYGDANCVYTGTCENGVWKGMTECFEPDAGP